MFNFFFFRTRGIRTVKQNKIEKEEGKTKGTEKYRRQWGKDRERHLERERDREI